PDWSAGRHPVDGRDGDSRQARHSQRRARLVPRCPLDPRHPARHGGAGAHAVRGDPADRGVGERSGARDRRSAALAARDRVAGTARAALAALGERRAHTRVIAVVAAPIVALAALAALDLATGGNAHFTRSVLRAGGLHDVADIAQRRVELSYHSLGAGLTPL